MRLPRSGPFHTAEVLRRHLHVIRTSCRSVPPSTLSALMPKRLRTSTRRFSHRQAFCWLISHFRHYASTTRGETVAGAGRTTTLSWHYPLLPGAPACVTTAVSHSESRAAEPRVLGLDDTHKEMPARSSLSCARMRGSPLFPSQWRTSSSRLVGPYGTLFACI